MRLPAQLEELTSREKDPEHLFDSGPLTDHERNTDGTKHPRKPASSTRQTSSLRPPMRMRPSLRGAHRHASMRMRPSLRGAHRHALQLLVCPR